MWTVSRRSDTDDDDGEGLPVGESDLDEWVGCGCSGARLTAGLHG